MVAASQVRAFATIDHLRSIRELEEIGMANLSLTKPYGLDYEAILAGSGQKRIGETNVAETYRSFEDEINAQYGDLKSVVPISRLSKRAGILGYKVGMTHYWDKWGVMVPCTVLQLDRCQVTQVKTMQKDGVDSI